MANPIKTLGDYLNNRDKSFVIPNYQRGYKWAVRGKEEGSAVEKLLSSLIEAFNERKESYFIQGITVSEDKDSIILIDGQQRTTTLYFLLWCLEWDGFKNFRLKYEIRKESEKFINNLKESKEIPTTDAELQDIHYFKEAINQIKFKLEDKDIEKRKKEFCEYILNNVKILYIPIPKDKATKTFTMMNGNKAKMLPEELIKAEMLRKISLPDTKKKNVSTSVDENLAELKEIIAKDWETNALRSRYAREWDKWLYWWNKEEVKFFFGIDESKIKRPMGLLLEYYFLRHPEKKSDFNFNNFKELIEDKKQTKECFEKLRKLQKSFEDIFNKPTIHNYLGLSLIDAKDKKNGIIEYFIANKANIEELADYAKWRMIDVAPNEDKEMKHIKAQDILEQLSASDVYWNEEAKKYAFKQLIRLNVEEDNKLERQFDFRIWKDKSLEHIHPKSKIYHKNSEGKYFRGEDELSKQEIQEIEQKNTNEKMKRWINKNDFNEQFSEHCIGNLVLLYKEENSGFGDKPFEEKKKSYFHIGSEKFKSRHLLHSIYVFTEEKWGPDEILSNKEKFIERFKKDYSLG
jgi:hypothetical protein